MATQLNPKDAEYRLPTNVRPTHYDLTVRTDLEKETFQGVVKVSLDVKKETSSITFNTAELDLTDASISSDATGTRQSYTSKSFNTEREEGTLVFPNALPAGSVAELSIAFSGKLTGSMMGYYKSAFAEDGKQSIYTLTQFEPTAARKAFPCWDEPALKATFAVSLISRAHLVNLGNMSARLEEPYNPNKNEDPDLAKLFSSLSVEDQQPKDEWKITRFHTTPLMSTYIVAYANGPFKYIEGSYTSPLSGKKRPLRVYTTPEVLHQAKHTLEISEKVMPIYEKVFDIEYPLPKLDTLVAHDFDAGAMENWGLITGRTSAFLMDPEKVQMSMLKRITTFQSHEIAHMWFGNITTMEWWDNLYLNEGFATLMGEYIIVGALYPEWKVDAEFISDNLNDALNLDAKLSSHPVEVPCPDANQIFDSLSYAKAASVLRMLSNYVGQERFIKGVSLYLKKHLYSNTVTKDLWEGIEEATDAGVPKMMDHWISKIGFPVVTVTETRDGITVRQDRFLETGHAEPQDNETLWTIPLCLLTVDEAGKPQIDKSLILDTREKTIALDTSKPYKLNAGTNGVYRVLYPDERLTRITNEAAKGEEVFSLNDRIGLVHDVFALSKAGFMDLSGALNAVNILHDEKDYLVWDTIASNLSLLYSTWWENPKVTTTLNEFRAFLFKPVVERLGYDNAPNDDPNTIQLRSKAVEQASRAGEPSAVKELQKRFAQYMNTGDDSHISPDIMRSTLFTGVRYGGRKEFEFTKKIIEGTTTPPATSISAMLALCQTQDPELIKEVFSYILNKTRTQNLIYMFMGLQSNLSTRRQAAEFFKQNFDEMEKRYADTFGLAGAVTANFNHLTKDEDYKVVEEFFKDKDRSKYHMAYGQLLDSLRASNAWIKRSTTDIEQWLDSWSARSKL
ncbi:leucyl aminopeptidase [Coniophora puteana RWD-64-598 SS2]|uniref:Aminopeptidase n=1 Tax=Coniophora puteana (strain RWD-64-598) TaxID=741705 RepID=A0A5M3MNK7_CONPW|nr:leucyl aminopeptidase [Coniophora puteana RWD-64-598 SS2]EIW80374.1 leucyl aminopeptidase [Coniophora puteana RWD-64-598 SS2]